jgi:hypothetical protein
MRERPEEAMFYTGGRDRYLELGNLVLGNGYPKYAARAFGEIPPRLMTKRFAARIVPRSLCYAATLVLSGSRGSNHCRYICG